MGSMKEIENPLAVGPIISTLFLIANVIFSFIIKNDIVTSLIILVLFFLIMLFVHNSLIRLNKGVHDYIGFRWLNKSAIINSILVFILCHIIGLYSLFVIPIVHILLRFTIKVKGNIIHLNKPWIFNDRNMECKSGTVIQFYKNGMIKELTLNDNWIHPDFGFKLKKDTKVEFSKYHHFLKYTLADNWQGNQRAIIKKDVEIEFHDNQEYKRIVIVNDIYENGIIILPANKYLFFKKSGKTTINSKFEIDQYLKYLGRIEDKI
jgi:hypothetical protein